MAYTYIKQSVSATPASEIVHNELLSGVSNAVNIYFFATVDPGTNPFDLYRLESNGQGILLRDGVEYTRSGTTFTFKRPLGYGQRAYLEILVDESAVPAPRENRYVKDDGSTPFLAPQAGVAATNPNHLATLAQVQAGSGGALTAIALTGAIDGTNAAFTMSPNPTAALFFMRNGVGLFSPEHYTRSGAVLTLGTPPQAGDRLDLYSTV